MATSVTPFLKWAGGKRWLAERLAEIIHPVDGTYFEPFLGSGAAYFRIKPERAVLSDVNKELINTYKTVRDRPDLVRRYLAEHHYAHSKEYYYLTRSKQHNSAAKKAARFIYLNRTCWNALYRVNRSGKFNVPIGTKQNVLLKTDDFNQVSNLLAGAELLGGDFETVIARANESDFLFIDPPYTVKHNNNGFVKYNEDMFTWADQERLSEAVQAAANRGAQVVMTNANHESIKELYSPTFSLFPIGRASVIAADAKNRVHTSELLITNIELAYYHLDESQLRRETCRVSR